MTEQALRKMIATGESTRQEFKSWVKCKDYRQRKELAVKSAVALAKSGHQTGKKMEEILTVKKKTPKWKEWAEINLGVKPEDFSQWIMETRNPALKPK